LSSLTVGPCFQFENGNALGYWQKRFRLLMTKFEEQSSPSLPTSVLCLQKNKKDPIKGNELLMSDMFDLLA
jgi:hypothetical protein